jgi:peptide/nickel transport system permease protein
MPGDVVDVLGLEGGLTDEQKAEVRRELGLDKPIVLQFLDWIAKAAAGDLGTSIRFDRPVSDMIGQALPVTMRFAGLSFAFGLSLAVALAIIATATRSRAAERAVDILNVWSIAIPYVLRRLCRHPGLLDLARLAPRHRRLAHAGHHHGAR